MARPRESDELRRIKFWNKVDYGNIGCWLFKTNERYGTFYYQQRVIGAHVLVWLWFKGTIPDGLQVLHLCDIKTCVRPSHLELGTPSKNHTDAWARGLIAPTQIRKLSHEDRLEIIELLDKGLTPREIAPQFGVHRASIYDLKRRDRQYKYLNI